MKPSVIVPAYNEIATIAESIRQGNGSGGGSSSNWWGPDERPLLVHGQDIQLGHREVPHIGCYQTGLLAEGGGCDEGIRSCEGDPMASPFSNQLPAEVGRVRVQRVEGKAIQEEEGRRAFVVPHTLDDLKPADRADADLLGLSEPLEK